VISATPSRQWLVTSVVGLFISDSRVSLAENVAGKKTYLRKMQTKSHQKINLTFINLIKLFFVQSVSFWFVL